MTIEKQPNEVLADIKPAEGKEREQLLLECRALLVGSIFECAELDELLKRLVKLIGGQEYTDGNQRAEFTLPDFSNLTLERFNYQTGIWHANVSFRVSTHGATEQVRNSKPVFEAMPRLELTLHYFKHHKLIDSCYKPVVLKYQVKVLPAEIQGNTASLYTYIDESDTIPFWQKVLNTIEMQEEINRQRREFIESWEFM